MLMVLSLCSAAHAQDVFFYNATSRGYKILMTLPNGTTDTHPISDSSDSMATDYFNLAPGIQEVKIQLTDDQGSLVCSGSARRDAAYTFFSEGSGVKMVQTGFYGGKDVQAALFMNATGEPLILDLMGNNGLGSVRGIVAPANAFDPKAPVRLDPREASYAFKVTTTGGAAVSFYNDNANVTPGKYYLLRKDARGLYRLETLGYIQR